jgi:hypothetical protein
MTVRHVLLLAAIAAALVPLCLLAFGDGQTPNQPWSPPAVTATAPAGTAPKADVTVDMGCVDRPLAYGLTNDQARGEQYNRALLDPFAPHPPLPRIGYYAPGRGPDQPTLVHALYHGYVVVRYRPGLANVIERDLRVAVGRAAQPVVLVSGRGMPFAVGALVYGRESVCGKLSRTTVGQLTEWIESARPQRARR